MGKAHLDIQESYFKESIICRYFKIWFKIIDTLFEGGRQNWNEVRTTRAITNLIMENFLTIKMIEPIIMDVLVLFVG